MRRGLTVGVCVVLLIACGIGCLSWLREYRETHEPSKLAFAEYCAHCHGHALQGGKLGPPLIGVELQNGDSTAALIRAIGGGYPELHGARLEGPGM